MNRNVSTNTKPINDPFIQELWRTNRVTSAQTTATPSLDRYIRQFRKNARRISGPASSVNKLTKIRKNLNTTDIFPRKNTDVTR